jgi:hypothetical protein
MKLAALVALLSFVEPVIHGADAPHPKPITMQLDVALPTTTSTTQRFITATAESLARDLDEAITAGEIAADERDSCRDELKARPNLIVEKTPGRVPWVIAGAAVAGAILGAIGTIGIVEAVNQE